MPCTDGGPSYIEEYYEAGVKFEAILCGILTSVEKSGRQVSSVFNDIDWKEAGVKRSWAENWWVEHKEEDAERRIREAEEAAREAARISALSKLTNAEKKALGLS